MLLDSGLALKSVQVGEQGHWEGVKGVAVGSCRGRRGSEVGVAVGS